MSLANAHHYNQTRYHNYPQIQTKRPNTSPIGTYNDGHTCISLRIIVPFEVKVIFDASLSDFAVNTIQVFDSSGWLISFSDSDQDATLSFVASVRPFGEYSITFGGASDVSGFYNAA
eukprot:346457_1